MGQARRVCVRGLIYKGGKLFGQKLRNSSGDWWCTPGGGVEFMESLHDALTREMIEETGVKPTIGRLVLVQQFATKGQNSHGDEEQLEFFFLIENTEDYMVIDLKSTTHGELEVAEYGFVDPVEKNMLPAILQSQAIVSAITKSQAVVFYTDLDKH